MKFDAGYKWFMFFSCEENGVERIKEIGPRNSRVPEFKFLARLIFKFCQIKRFKVDAIEDF